jgi:hypothetical protein
MYCVFYSLAGLLIQHSVMHRYSVSHSVGWLIYQSWSVTLDCPAELTPLISAHSLDLLLAQRLETTDTEESRALQVPWKNPHLSRLSYGLFTLFVSLIIVVPWPHHLSDISYWQFSMLATLICLRECETSVAKKLELRIWVLLRSRQVGTTCLSPHHYRLCRA